jgi:hypothetical protein
MTVHLDGEVLRLTGECRVEDAEPLYALLHAVPARRVDLSGAAHLHAAVVQVIMALRPCVEGPVTDPFTARWLVPLFGRISGG